MKKYVLRILVGLCLFTLIGCSMASQALDDDAHNKNSKQTKKIITKAIPAKNIKIGVLYISDPAEGSGYTYSHDLGIQGMQQNLGLRDDQLVIKKNISDADPQAINQAITECIEAGCHIIFGTSYGYMDQMAAMAEKHPDIYFSHGSGSKSNGKNFNHYFGRIYQPRYLSGIAAGLKTRSNKIGYIAAMDQRNAEVTGGLDAFAMGIYAVNPQAIVYVKITNSWFDPPKEKAAAQKLLTLGCDVLSQHCDTSYPLQLAEQYGRWGIGYNSDMSKETPNAALLSVIWNWSAYYTIAVQSVIEGSWDGSNYYGGMQEGVVSITKLAQCNDPKTNAKIAQVTASFLDGSFDVFNGVIETNTGKKVGTPGHTLDDTTITSGINWYFKNIVVIQ